MAKNLVKELFPRKRLSQRPILPKASILIATIAAAIQKSKQFNVDVAYDSLADDPQLTSLVVTPRAGEAALPWLSASLTD